MAAALLAGCGGSQPPSAEGVAVLQNAMSPGPGLAHRVRKTSSSHDDLFFAATANDTAFWLTYPDGEKVGKVPHFGAGHLCAGPNGNVYVIDNDAMFVFEHGGVTPVATLYTPSQFYAIYACSVDPTTGNLAAVIVNWESVPNVYYVGIYANASGTPTLYRDGNAAFSFCGYDATGNLFVDAPGAYPNGLWIAELPKGASTFNQITLNEPIDSVVPGRVQWDSQYMAFHTEGPGRREDTIYRVAVSGSSGMVVGTVKFLKGSYPFYGGWIEGANVIGLHGRGPRDIGIWNYPTGGKPAKVIPNLLGNRNWYLDVVVSPGG